ncbi:MAG TPA: isocitrate lyase/phosphoenolpyruvate mutase family protein [Alphaproteobacteria bacterium]|nr:isocitrate lyase/phosphoenolpyruvate mutase family protein [Alphaproteobacteria bacterium]
MSQSQAEKAEIFAALHERDGAFVIPNPWDIGTTRILEALGFEALATTSAGYAHSRGLRDGANAIGREEMLAHAREIVEASDLPVSADLENGFGDAPEDAAQTIRGAIGVGLAGASIEDATMDPANPIYDKALAVERIAAAVEAARTANFPFMLTARAENFIHGRPDLDDTIARLTAFEAAGADVLYAPGLRSLDQIRAVCEAVSKPVNVVAGLGGVAFTVAELSEAGVRRISLGSTLSRLAFGAFIRAAKEMQEDGTFGFSADAVPYANLQDYMKG